MKRTTTRQNWFVLNAFLFGALTSAGAADVQFIGEFEALGNDWKRYADRPVAVEGRFSSFGRDQIRFAGSQLRVKLDEPATRPRDTRNVIVSGLLKDDGGRPVLEAIRVRPGPTDERWLADRRATLRQDEPDAWLELADDVRTRGTFYDDDSLLEEAAAVEEVGFRTLIANAGRDVASLRSAADRIGERGGPDEIRLPVLHKADRLAWKAVKPNLKTPAGRATAALVLDRIGQDLPGALTPLAAPRPNLITAYALDPIMVYDNADLEQRPVLHRLFFAEVVVETTEAELKPDDSNADTLAKRLEEALPDRPALAELYREKAMASAMASIEKLTETELVDLAARLDEAHPDGKRGERAVTQWLAMRRASAEADGGSELLRLAEDTERLTGSKEQAAARYIAAAEAEQPEAVDWLKANDYELVGGAWRPRDTSKSDQTFERRVAIGELELGMSAADVRRAMGTVPPAEDMIRIATQAGVTEYWTYRELGVVLTLERSKVSSRVTRIDDLP